MFSLILEGMTNLQLIIGFYLVMICAVATAHIIVMICAVATAIWIMICCTSKDVAYHIYTEIFYNNKLNPLIKDVYNPNDRHHNWYTTLKPVNLADNTNKITCKITDEKVEISVEVLEQKNTNKN